MPIDLNTTTKKMRESEKVVFLAGVCGYRILERLLTAGLGPPSRRMDKKDQCFNQGKDSTSKEPGKKGMKEKEKEEHPPIAWILKR